MSFDDASFIVPFLKRLEYDKIDKLREIKDRRKLERLDTSLRGSINDTHAVFFFPGFFAEFTPYGYRYSSVYSAQNEANYILHAPELNEKFLRKLFTGIELVIYILSKLTLYAEDRRYTFEKERTVSRLNKLKELINVPNWQNFRAEFDEIFHVRNAFAHSFIDIDEIEYKDMELRECFGKSYLGRSYISSLAPGEKSFIDNARYIMSPLMTAFYDHQLKQININKLFRSCDAVLRARSLGR